jgi:hypothetical protein
VLVGRVEVLDGFESKGEVVAGAAFVFVEDEAVDGDEEPDRDVAEESRVSAEGACF